MEDSVPIVMGPARCHPLRPPPAAVPFRQPERLRAPANFRARVIAAFRSARNVEYMRGKLAGKCLCPNLAAKMYEFSNGAGPAYDILGSDPLARRGNSRQASDMWSEVRRLNRGFYDMNVCSADLGGEEPYHMRAFIDDSLQPPGLEHLNDPDRSTASGAGLVWSGEAVEAMPHYAEEDWAWSAGDPNRSAEQAAGEYWGEDMSSSEAGANLARGPSFSEQALRGEWWFTSDSGPRRQRYETIPFWQRTGERNFDGEIGDTLGSGARETGNLVRGWDMERLRNPRGQEYRRYGPRSSGFS